MPILSSPRRAIMPVTFESIRKAFGLPDDVSVRAVLQDPNNFSIDTVDICLEGLGLPICCTLVPGAMAQKAYPIYRTISVPRFEGWS